MITCSFLGHRDVYDADIDIRLQAAVDQIVDKNESVDFVLFPDKGFFDCCLWAVLKAKSRCPQKVKVCLFVSKEDAAGIMRQFPGQVPVCMIDTLIPFERGAVNHHTYHTRYRKFLRFVAQNSTHIIFYVYKKIYSQESRIYGDAEILRNAEVISVTSPETEQAILESIKRMSEKERLVFEKIGGGCTLQETGKLLGVGKERTRQILQQGCRVMLKDIEIRRYRMLSTMSNPKRSCGVFGLGETNPEMVKQFEHIVNHLVSRYRIGTVYIDSIYAHSEIMNVLKKSPALKLRLHVAAVTCEDVFSDTNYDNRDLKARFCPPCDSVLCVGWPDSENDTNGRGVISSIIERTDFCIFDSSVMSGAKKIRQPIVLEKRTVLLAMDSVEPRILTV